MQNEIFTKNYNLLNQEQKKAVDKIDGPIMVVAGPGTGKTQIIALRTANIIKKANINPENILITTFTDAGVIAIKKRLGDFLGTAGLKVNVSTIHSFSKNVIDSFPDKFIEYRAGYAVDDVDILEILKNIIDDLVSKKIVVELTNDFDKYLYLRDIKSRIGTLKQEGFTKTSLESLISDLEQKYVEELSEIKPTLKKYETTQKTQQKHISKLKELSIIFEAYNQELRKNSYYDFNDMINFVLQKFQSDEELRYFYAEKFQYIMIDEFQDTNNAQNQILDLILSVSDDLPNIMVVGDDDQSIYRFQGANIENMLDFATKYPETEFIVLKNNYRSTQNILDLCTNLIDYNNQRLSKKVSIIEKKLISSNTTLSNLNNKIYFATPNTLELERAFLLENIKKYLNDGVSPSEIAIIVRNNKEVQELSLFFEQNNISVVSKQNTDILQNEYVIFILKFLKCLLNPDYKEDFFIDICRSTILGLNQIDIFKINKYLYSLNYTRKQKISFFDFLLNIEKYDDLELSNLQSIINFRDLFILSSQKLSQMFFVEYFNEFLKDFNILNYIETNGNFDDIQDVFTLFNKIKDFCLIDKNFSLTKFITKIELYQSYNFSIPRQIIKTQKTGINILTAHSSKGLEYEIVFVPGLYDGNWNNKRVIDKLKLPLGIAGKGMQQDFDPIEEDRRLFFVACSRAKKVLFLSTPLSIDNKLKIVSTFVQEINGFYDNYGDISLTQENFNQTISNSLKPVIYKFEDAEFDYIKEFLESYKLSPTDLNTFLDDPLKFLNSVIFKYPFVDNDALIFGKVYHRVLELFYSKYKTEGKMQDLSYLEFSFEALLKREILSPESYEKLLEKGLNGFRGLYPSLVANNRKILSTEYNFRPKNLFFDNIPVTGKIDKIEICDINSSPSQNLGQLAFFKENVVLVDYKTGKPKTIGEIKGIDKDGNKKQTGGNYLRQLLFYKLLCDLDLDFSSKYDISGLALDFVEGRDGEYKYIEVDYTIDDYIYFKDELATSWQKITNIDFWKEILNK